MKMEGRMSYVTVIKSIKPETLGKLFKLTDAGVLTKNAVANVWVGKATSVCVDAPEGLAKVLKHACQRGDLALMSGRLSGGCYQASGQPSDRAEARGDAWMQAG